MNESPLEARISRRTAIQAGLGTAAALSLSALLENLDIASSSAKVVRRANGKTVKTLSVGLPGTLSNLYPGIEDGILNYYVASLILEGLVAVSPAGEVVPAIASSWERPNASTYIYTLRSDAKFGDGTPVTVEDVLYSITEAGNPKASPNVASYWAGVKATQTGTNEVTVKLGAPSEPFQFVPSAADALWIAPKAFWQANKGTIGTAQALLNGTGPYKVTSFQPDSHVTLEATGNWWGGKPKVDEINIQFITDDNARYLAQKAGDIQMSFNVPFESLSQWQSLPDTKVVSIPDRSWVGLIFNVKSGPASDLHVRRAIAHCIDRPAIVSELLKGQGQVATAMTTPQQFPGVYSAAEATATLSKIPQLSFSISKAKQELAKSAYPHGFSTTLTYPNTGPQLGTAALSLAQNLAQIGITLTVKELAVAQWLNTIGAANTPISFMWYFNTTPDPSELPGWLLQSDPANPAKYANSKVDALLAKAASELDAGKHAATIIQAETLANQDLPYLSLWWGHSATAFSSHIKVSDYTSYTFESPWADSLSVSA